MYAFWPEKRIYEIKYVGLFKKDNVNIKLCESLNSKLEFYEGII